MSPSEPQLPAVIAVLLLANRLQASRCNRVQAAAEAALALRGCVVQRRCYWLLESEDGTVLVHYLNVLHVPVRGRQARPLQTSWQAAVEQKGKLGQCCAVLCCTAQLSRSWQWPCQSAEQAGICAGCQDSAAEAGAIA